MMQARPVASNNLALVAALEAASLPTEDLHDAGRSFFAVEDDGKAVGFGGFELYGEDALLRSVVVLPQYRGQGKGRDVTEAILARAYSAGARQAWLLTTTAEGFFERDGFARVPRASAPESILSTKQTTTICTSATMLTRPLRPHA